MLICFTSFAATVVSDADATLGVLTRSMFLTTASAFTGAPPANRAAGFRSNV